MRTQLIRCLFVSSLFLGLLAFGPMAVAEQPPVEWTIMVYLDGDNNLEHSALMDMLEMEQAIPEDVEIVVLLDRHKAHSDVLGNWSGTRLYRVRKGQPFDIKKAAMGLAVPLPKDFASELLEDWGEADMADPATLVRFIEKAAARFPAKRYALIPWDHGSGAAMAGMLNDEDGGKGSMTVDAFAKAVQQGAQSLPRKRFDLLKYELCLMGQLDVLFETVPLADYAFASPPVEPCQGSDYLSILPLLRKDLSTRELVAKMVDLNIAYYTDLGRPAAFSAYDLSAMGEVNEKLLQLSRKLKELAPTQFKALTRATCFATHHGNLLEDLKSGQKATSSVEVDDWLARLDQENLGLAEYLKPLREALGRLVYYSKSTPNLPECQGLSIYLPLRREFEQPRYQRSAFAQASGFADYLQALYTAQETLGDEKPRIDHVVIGAPRLKPGLDGSNATDFTLLPIDHIQPFAHNVVRFDVTGTGILLTKLIQFEEAGQERIVNFEQLVGDHSDRQAGKGSVFSEISPRYNDGTTTLMRELSAKYKVSNGLRVADITITNLSTSRDIGQNVSVGWGLYRDATTGGQDLLVQVQFSNLLRWPITMLGFTLDGQGRITSVRQIQPRNDGIFRPARVVLDQSGRQRRVFGEPMPLSQGVFLLTLDMLDAGRKVGYLIQAQTMNGKSAMAQSQIYPVRHKAEQDSMRNNAQANGLGNLFGQYAMVQFASSGQEENLALPTFQTITLQATRPAFSFVIHDGEKEQGSGLAQWLPLGMPQLSLHKKPKMSNVPFGETIETWYAFLDGAGLDRTWYMIGMGNGTRWAFVPLERYQAAALEGVWTSKTERWEFRGNTVQLTRDGHTGRGRFDLKGHLLWVTGMPRDCYAVYLEPRLGHLTLMSRKGEASILTRQGGASPVQRFEGSWQSPETGIRCEISKVPASAWYSLRLQRPGQESRCTFAVQGNSLYATFANGQQMIIGFAFRQGELFLFFPQSAPLRLVPASQSSSR
ncbi:MAG: hypothetical protein K6G15_08650 [Desulfovibrio sp.]|nr:hypothetical protein [Desulfovibrio sp.]